MKHKDDHRELDWWKERVRQLEELSSVKEELLVTYKNRIDALEDLNKTYFNMIFKEDK